MSAKTPLPAPPRRKKQPRVGIFWLVGGKLVIDSLPLSEAEPYGDHLTYPRSHLEVWTLFQKKGTAPSNLEYEEPTSRSRGVQHKDPTIHRPRRQMHPDG
jgi:hypothetical protein